MKVRWVFIVICCLAGGVVHSQPHYGHFNRSGVEHGLLSEAITAVCQDKQGFLWVGSINGLQRFDGRTFKTIDPKIQGGTLSIAHESIGMLYHDNLGRLWMLAGKRLGFLDVSNHVFIDTPLPDNLTLSAESKPWESPSGELFLVSNRECVFQLNPATLQWEIDTQLQAHGPGRAMDLEGEKQSNRLWVATDRGIQLYTLDKQTWLGDHVASQYAAIKETQGHVVLDVHADSRGRLWYVFRKNMETQLACMDLSSGQAIAIKPNVHSLFNDYFSLNSIAEDAFGGIWLYGRNALLIVPSGSDELRLIPHTGTRGNGITFGEIRCLFPDREKAMWMATDNGLYHGPLSLPGVRHQPFEPSYSEHNTSGMVEDRQGNIWVSFWGQPLHQYNSELVQKDAAWVYEGLKTKDLADALSMLNIGVHRGSGALIGCLENGKLLWIDPVHKSASIVQLPSMEGIPVSAITEGPGGSLWIGLVSGHIFHWATPSAASVPGAHTQVQGIIAGLYTDQRDCLWVATMDKGVYRLPGSTQYEAVHLSSETQPNSLSDDAVEAIIPVDDSTVYIAAGRFHRYNPITGTITVYRHEQGHSTNDIQGMFLDNYGKVWLAAYDGVSRFTPSSKSFVNYNDRDGFLRGGSYGDVGLLHSNGDMIWASSFETIAFTPTAFSNQWTPPPVVITDCNIAGEWRSPQSQNTEAITLSHRQNDIALEFASLSYLYAEKIRYQYRLLGGSEQWVTVDAPHELLFSNLAPGKYTFEVKSVNDYNEESIPTAFAFEILPPFWLRWWFILVLLVAVGIIVYAIYRWRIEKLMEIEDVRSRVARDLHDDVGSTLSTINILSSMAKSRMYTDSAKAMGYLHKINDNSQRMMEVMDDIVWSIQPDNDNFQKLTARMREFATTILEPKDIDVHFTVDAWLQEIKLNMEQRRDLFLIYKEAINNAAKYSGASRVEIELNHRSAQVILTIRDNGTGFDSSLSRDGNGLSNMQKRARILCGRLNIESAPSKGTLVHLEFQLT
jgi:signal transduction histidine kinase/ligand-binding sensor domain-containing protein